MKKIMILLVAAVFGFQFAGHAQVRVGISAGATVASMEGMDKANNKGGLLAGLVVNKPVGKHFAFQPSLSYTQKGVTLSEPTLLLEKRNYCLRYIEMNADFLYATNNSNGSSFYIGAGPSIAFDLPSKKVDIAKDSDVPDNSTTILFGREAGNDMKGFDYGVNFSMAYRLAGGFMLGANYVLGLRDLSIEGSTKELKNRYLGIRLTYFLENGKKK